MAKTVFITGASSGFGYESVLKFQKEGWNVVATMRKPENDKLLGDYKNVKLVALDVTDRASIDQAVEAAIAEFGSIDVLVNNAGFGVAGFLEEASAAEVDNQINTNLRGVVWVTQAILPHMRKQKSGVIINITSIGGNIAMPMMALYSATKFAVEGLTESMRYELEPFGIRALSIAPGAFKTGFGNATIWTDGNAKAELNSHREMFKSHYAKVLETPPKPFGYGHPREVAKLIFKRAVKEGSHRNFVGKDAKLLSRIRKILPQRTLDNMIKSSILPQNW